MRKNFISEYSEWFLAYYACSIDCEEWDKTATFSYVQGEISRIRKNLYQAFVPIVQQNTWMDGRIMKDGRKNFKGDLNNFDRYAGLLLDDFVCRKSNNLKNSIQSDNCLLHLIPPHNTSLLQLWDVSINKPMKNRSKNSAF